MGIKIAGNKGELWLCATGGALAKVLSNCTCKIDPAVKTQDATSTDSAGADEHIAGNTSYKLTYSGRFDVSELKLVGAPPVIANGAMLDFKFYPNKTTYPNIWWGGTGTNRGPSIGTDQGTSTVLTYDGEIEGTGALVVPASM